MRANELIPMLAAGVALCVFYPAEVRAELVERSMYKDSAGGTVSQYVYQGGRSSGTSNYARSRSYGYGYSPYYRGGYCGPGASLHVQPHAINRGYSGQGNVRGSYTGGNVRVFARW